MKIKRLCVVFLCALFIFIGQASAAVSTIVAFGDSLSDNGNADGYGFKRYTDNDPVAKPVWVEILADFYGAQLYDYAHGGATTGMGNITGLKWSGLTWQLHGDRTDIRSTIEGLDKSETLFTVWAGVNDLGVGTLPGTAVDQLMANLDILAELGAEQILVPDLPDIGLTPRYYGTPKQTAVSGFIHAFNAEFDLALQGFANRFAGTVYTLNLDQILGGIVPGSFTWEMMFWDEDGYHPSGVGHELIAYAAENPLVVVPVATPVPGSGLLTISGIMGLAALRRRQDW